MKTLGESSGIPNLASPIRLFLKGNSWWTPQSLGYTQVLGMIKEASTNVQWARSWPVFGPFNSVFTHRKKAKDICGQDLLVIFLADSAGVCGVLKTPF